MDRANIFLKEKTSCYVAIAANGTGDLFFKPPWVIDILNLFQVTLVSELTWEQTCELGFEYVDNINHYVKNLIGKGYIIPFAENILAQVKK